MTMLAFVRNGNERGIQVGAENRLPDSVTLGTLDAMRIMIDEAHEPSED